MTTRPLIICLIGLLCLGLTACEQCGIDREPTAQLSFFSPVPKFQKIRVLGSPKDTLSRRELLFANFITGPLNLHSNQTTYVFERANRTDTLTVFYQQKIYNASSTCNYVLDLEAPARGVLFKSTFKEVSVQYNSLYSKGGWGGGGAETSITIIVSEP